MNKSDGGMWIKTAKSGLEYFSGLIEINGCKYNFAAFKNTYKQDGSKQPDYTIKLREDTRGEEPPSPF